MGEHEVEKEMMTPHEEENGPPENLIINSLHVGLMYGAVATTVTVTAWLYGWLYGLDARLESHVKVQAEEMKAIDARFSVGADDRYRGSQARSDFALRDERINALNQQFIEIKADLNEIKRLLMKGHKEQL